MNFAIVQRLVLGYNTYIPDITLFISRVALQNATTVPLDRYHAHVPNPCNFVRQKTNKIGPRSRHARKAHASGKPKIKTSAGWCRYEHQPLLMLLTRLRWAEISLFSECTRSPPVFESGCQISYSSACQWRAPNETPIAFSA